MKKINVFTVLLISAIFIAGCANPLSTPEGGTTGKGYVQVNIGSDNAQLNSILSRAVLPDSFSFTSFDLLFTNTDNTGHTVPFNGLTSLSSPLEIEVGTYSLHLTAYIGDHEAAANGDSTGDIEITESDTPSVPKAVSVPITFVTPGGPNTNGILSYTITNSSGITPTLKEMSFTNLGSGDNPATITDLTLGSAATAPIPAGYYIVRVTLEGGGKKAVKSDVVHIYKGQTTVLTWEVDKSFTNVDTIWVSGSMTNSWNWASMGTPMAEEDNGTFTWTGTANANDQFRFSIESTLGWDNDKNKGRRFQPENGATAALGNNPFVFGERNTLDTIWTIPYTDTYTFTVDPYAMELTITSPLPEIITTPISSAPQITNDNLVVHFTKPVTISGSGDYGFTLTADSTVTVTGISTVSSDTVTFTLSGTVTPGETISLAYTGTAVKDVHGQEMAAVTGQPVVSLPKLGTVTPALSTLGVATWAGLASETGVAKYSVQLYKGSEKQGGAIEVSQGGTYSHDFLSAMRAAGVAAYHVTVTAIGDNETHVDGPESAASGTQTTIGLTPPEWTWWTGKSVGWKQRDSTNANVTSYSVQLYKDGAPDPAQEYLLSEGTPNGNGGDAGKQFEKDFSSSMINVGVYTFKVKAVGVGLYIDSDEVTVASPYTVATFTDLEIANEDSTTTTTTSLTLTFDYLIPGLAADKIGITGDAFAGIGKGALSQVGGTAVYTLPITGVSTGGPITLTITPPSNCSFVTATQNVNIYYKLPTPASLVWTGTTASWGAITHAEGFSVALYKDDDTLPITTVTPALNSYNFDGVINTNGAGSYTFTVQAKAPAPAEEETIYILDSEVSSDSPPLVAKAVGGIVMPSTSLVIEADITSDIAELSIEGTGYTNYKWFINGRSLASTATIKLDVSSKTYTVYVEATVDGKVQTSDSYTVSSSGAVKQ
jgi:hypothetical protein